MDILQKYLSALRWWEYTREKWHQGEPVPPQVASSATYTQGVLDVAVEFNLVLVHDGTNYTGVKEVA
jgi:hypothetical protein